MHGGIDLRIIAKITILSILVCFYGCDLHADCQKCYSEEIELRELTDKALKIAKENSTFDSSKIVELTLENNALDAWGLNRRIQVFEHNNEWCIFIWSLGADNKPEGTGYDRDIFGVGNSGQCITKVST